MAAQQTIGILVPWRSGIFLGNVLIGAHGKAGEHNLRLMVICTAIQTPSQRDIEMNYLIPYPPGADKVAGWITIGDALEPPGYQRLVQSGAPIVAIARNQDDRSVPLVVADNHGGMAAAVHHLIEHGHTRIAFVGSLFMTDFRERYEGYQAALSAHGLTPNPALLIDVERPWGPYGPEAANRLLALGMPCTAIACGNDDLAIGMMPVLQAAGYRIPEDLAIIGFDDRDDAQYQQPPLSSVSQKSAALGTTAMESLAKMMAGEQIPYGPHRVATALVARRSCGCDTQDTSILTAMPALQADQDWQALLMRRMLALTMQPIRPNPAIAPTQVWPGLKTLVGALRAALYGLPTPPSKDIALAWEQAMALTVDLKLLHAVDALLEEAGAALLPQTSAPQKAAIRLNAVLSEIRFELSQALLAFETKARWLYAAELNNISLISAALLRETNSAVGSDLSWLQWTRIRWGCLGMWEGALAADHLPDLTLMAGYARDDSALPEQGSVSRWSEFMPTDVLLGEGGAQPSDVIFVVPFETTYELGGMVILLETMDPLFIQHYHLLHDWTFILTMATDRQQLLLKLNRQQRALLAAKDTAERASAFKTQFLSNMSHELRTPLNAILNFTYYMGDTELANNLNDDQLQLQQRVLANANHLLGLINDTLDLAKIESGKFALQHAAIDLRLMLDEVMETAAGLIADKELVLTLEVPEQLPTLWADQMRVRQVLLNLLSNAAKFTQEGGITLHARETGDGFVEIAVSDTGIGIAPEHQERIFEEFQQVQRAQDDSLRGTGLGLPISKRLIELHGGRMWLESGAGLGSTFKFTLPLRSAAF